MRRCWNGSKAAALGSANVSKGSFRFAPVMCLPAAFETVEKMPQSTFDEILEKYVEMNVAHPFREDNGRATRMWLDVILGKELGLMVDWSLIGKEEARGRQEFYCPPPPIRFR